MRLILTHENSDFDAVASQMAAHKLYPDTVPLLSRRLNRNVEQFLMLYWNAFSFMRASDWAKQRVDALILVDTQSVNSVRGVVSNPEIQVIDHHVDYEPKEDWAYQVEGVGATTTLLVEQMRHTGVTLTREEATLLLLGIYEDTGSLTYDTTTPRDVAAAAWVLEQGAMLSVVRRFLNIPLTPAQRELFDRLQAAVEWIDVKGQSLVVAAATVPDDFQEEISSVVHRLRDALAVGGLFVLVQISQDVQLVARSNSDQIDVGYVAEKLGGGGHSRAAAALVPKRDLEDVRQELMSLLSEAVQPGVKVVQLMSVGVQTIDADTTVEQAATMMQRSGHEGYPVIDPEAETLVGLLTRRGVDRAMSHDMGRLPVSRVMKAGVVTVRPSDSIDKVQQLMLNEGWGQIPVLPQAETAANGRPIGIVTRTDLLNHLFQPSPEAAVPNMRRLLRESLHPALWHLVQVIGEVADELGMPLYFVGGLVRDLLLDHEPTDFDMVVEGNAMALAHRLRKRFGGDVHTHERFGTAKWFLSTAVWEQIASARVDNGAGAFTDLPDLPFIDFVTARTEFYTEPTALPTVTKGSIKLDLHRRDFAINTLALRLDGRHLGELLDFYGGQRDLDEGIIRVLHSLSFVDDPTRILRAVRLEQRLGFTIEPRTAELMENALPLLNRVSGSRIRHEIELSFHEPNPVAVMARFAELGVLVQIHPGLAWHEETADHFVQVPQMVADEAWRQALNDESPVFVYFALWMVSHPLAVQRAVMKLLMVRKATREDVRACRRALQALRELPGDAPPSRVERALRPFPPRALLVARIAASDAQVVSWVEKYYREWRHVKTAVTGHDLREMGLPPGPRYAVILDKLLAARLDGEVNDASDEQALLAELIAETEE